MENERIDVVTKMIAAPRYNNELAYNVQKLRNSIVLLELSGISPGIGLEMFDEILEVGALIKNTDDYIQNNPNCLLEHDSINEVIAEKLYGVRNACEANINEFLNWATEKMGQQNVRISDNELEELAKKWEMGNSSEQLSKKTFLYMRSIVVIINSYLTLIRIKLSGNEISLEENDLWKKNEPVLSSEGIEIVEQLMNLNEKNYRAKDETEISENIKVTHKQLLDSLEPSKDYNLLKNLIEKSIEIMFNKDYEIGTKSNTK